MKVKNTLFQRLEDRAVALFALFNSNKINIATFQKCLITLCTEFVESGYWNKKTVIEEFIPCLNEHFEDYQLGTLYLLSSTSEGSLLQNFKRKLI